MGGSRPPQAQPQQQQHLRRPSAQSPLQTPRAVQQPQQQIQHPTAQRTRPSAVQPHHQSPAHAHSPRTTPRTPLPAVSPRLLPPDDEDEDDGLPDPFMRDDLESGRSGARPYVVSSSPPSGGSPLPDSEEEDEVGLASEGIFPGSGLF
jgi:hypothetical protein